MFFKALKRKKNNLVASIYALETKLQEMNLEVIEKEISLLLLDSDKKQQQYATELIQKEIRSLVVSGVITLETENALRSNLKLKNEAVAIVKRNSYGLTRRPVKQSIRKLIINRDKCCLNCGSTKNLTIDHITPVVLGGENSYDNLQTLCQSCNSSKSCVTLDLRKTK